jgi:hypothetical protein
VLHPRVMLVTIKRNILFHGAAPFLLFDRHRQPTPAAGVALSYFHSERSGAVFSFSLAPANEPRREVEEPLFDRSRSQAFKPACLNIPNSTKSLITRYN